MSRGVENNACVISLNRFEITSRGGFGESGSIRIQWSVRTRRNLFEPIPLSQCRQALIAHHLISLSHVQVFHIFYK